MFKKFLITSLMLLPLMGTAKMSSTEFKNTMTSVFNQEFSKVVNGKKITVNQTKSGSYNAADYYVTIKNGTCKEYMNLTGTLLSISESTQVDEQVRKSMSILFAVANNGLEKATKNKTCTY